MGCCATNQIDLDHYYPMSVRMGPIEKTIHKVSCPLPNNFSQKKSACPIATPFSSARSFSRETDAMLSLLEFLPAVDIIQLQGCNKQCYEEFVPKMRETWPRGPALSERIKRNLTSELIYLEISSPGFQTTFAKLNFDRQFGPPSLDYDFHREYFLTWRRLSNGTFYQGQCNYKGNPNGKGIILTPKKSMCIGRFREGTQVGQCTVI